MKKAIALSLILLLAATALASCAKPGTDDFIATTPASSQTTEAPTSITEPPATIATQPATNPTSRPAAENTHPGTQQLDFGAQYIRTNGYHNGRQYPIITVVSTKNELAQYYWKYEKEYDFAPRTEAAADSTIGFTDAIGKYLDTDDFFEDSYLVIVLLEEGSGSIRHRVDSVAADGAIAISRLTRHMQTADMAEWNIIIEISGDSKPVQFKVEMTNEMVA